MKKNAPFDPLSHALMAVRDEVCRAGELFERGEAMIAVLRHLAAAMAGLEAVEQALANERLRRFADHVGKKRQRLTAAEEREFTAILTALRPWDTSRA